MLPLVGAIAAGSPILAEQNVEEEMAVPGILTTSGECFLLRVRGESMTRAGILDGDYVVVRRQPDCADGEIVAALVGGGEATVKRLDHLDGRVRLIPENDHMEPFFPDQVDVLGKIVGVFRRM
jgi:repressor LexA